ncbi:hypothetical protein Dda_1475 [Drechslerella dactyloides]|uniref:Uncharacterized protein n=1 Tax=Drechslerella dactyloides TaxID=74499 RepID=A0AAD6J693_DREDA|nr:hypothetical protein Dda_1475 [Drechslerella dactyloides]
MPQPSQLRPGIRRKAAYKTYFSKAGELSRMKASLNPSAPPFNPSSFARTVGAGPSIRVEATFDVSSNVVQNNSQPTSQPITTLKPPQKMATDGSDESSSLTDLIKRCTIDDQVKQANLMQQKLERFAYLTTRDVFVQSLFKAITCLSSSTAHHILKNHVKELAVLLKLFKMDDLVNAVVSLHSERVYSSSLEKIQETWPWLLDGDVTELSLIDLGSLTAAGPPTMLQETPKPKLPASKMSAAEANSLGSSPLAFKMRKHLQPQSTVSESLRSDGVCSMMSFDPSSEPTAPIDPYSCSFPYPTQRTILKESQQILKTALYMFAKQHLPKKLTHQAFEYPASSSLGQWVLMMQDAITNANTSTDEQASQNKLTALGSSHPNLLDPASELHDLLSKRQHTTTSELRGVLANVLKLIETLGASGCYDQQLALNIYTDILADDLKKKLEKIQIPFRKTLKLISDAKDQLVHEEEDATQSYREQEKMVQQEFLLDTSMLKGILSPNALSANAPATLPPKSTAGNRRSSIIRISRDLLTAPEKQLLDQRPADNKEEPVKSKLSALSFAWDPACIDKAVAELSHKEAKENRSGKADDIDPQIANSRNPSIPGPGLEGSKYASDRLFVPPKPGKNAIPIRAPPKEPLVADKENGLLIKF